METISIWIQPAVLVTAFIFFWREAKGSRREIKTELHEMESRILIRMDERFKVVDVRFDAVDRRFDEVDKRFDAVDRRFDRLEERTSSVEIQQGRLDERMTATEGRVNEMDTNS